MGLVAAPHVTFSRQFQPEASKLTLFRCIAARDRYSPTRNRGQLQNLTSATVDYRIDLGEQAGWPLLWNRGGKSELRRAGRWVTPRGGDPTESATETHRQRPAWPVRARVKWRGKSSPATGEPVGWVNPARSKTE